MGFGELWTFINNHCQTSEHFPTVNFNWSSSEGDDKPWIVIDYGHVVHSLSENYGGHTALFEERIERICTALATCGARICVVKDGQSRSAQRCVMKLDRMQQKISTGMDSPNVVLASKVALSLAYAIFRRVMDTVEKQSSNNGMFQFITENGEADPQIRNFARDKLLKGNTVYIMSNDASLLVGLNPSNKVFAVGIKSLELVGDITPGRFVLVGKPHLLSHVFDRLSTEANTILDRSNALAATALSEEMLVYVCALLGGETSYFRWGYFEQPTPIMDYLVALFKPFEKNKEFRLYTAVVFVRECFKGSDGFIKTIANHAKNALKENNRIKQAPYLFGIKPLTDIDQGIKGAARRMLQKEMLDGFRGGLDNPRNIDAVNDEMSARRNSSLDLGPVPRNDHEVLWGCAADFEVVGEDTDSLMSPLTSLVKQISHLENSAVSEEMKGFEMATYDGADPSFNRFNSFLRSLSESIVTPSGIQCRIIQTHNVLRRTTDQCVSIVEINNDVRQGNDIPNNGVLVRDRADRMGLHFFALEGDAIDRLNAYCKEDTRYSIGSTTPTNTSTLLDLHNRARYLALLRTSKRPPLVTEDQPERAAAIIFERLGLGSSESISSACTLISKCWDLLPCDVDSKAHLVTKNAATDTAMMLFATLYCYKSLFAPTHSTSPSSSRPLDIDSLVSRVAMALIISPLFSIHTDAGCPAIRLLSVTNLPRPRPNINLSPGAFSSEVLQFNKKFLKNTGSIFTKRVASCIDAVLDSTTDLLGYAEGTPEDRWVKHCRWFNLMGVQWAVRFLDEGGDLRAASEKSPDLYLFIESAMRAVGAVAEALQGV